MTDPSKPQLELLCGRVFTQQELQDIREFILLFPKLSQTELAKTICEMLDWYTPNGSYKIESCRELLKKLESREWISLPEKRQTRPLGQEPSPSLCHREEESEIHGPLSDLGIIQLQPVYSGPDIRLWNEYVARYHVLGYKRPFGAHQRYFIWSDTPQRRRLGCMLFAASAWALAPRDKWIGWNQNERSQQLHRLVNNTRFLIFPWVNVKNLASKALSLAVKRIRFDWQERYGFEPLLLETFVDADRYKGTCYQAANWIQLGLTTGRGRMDRHTQYMSSPKQIYVYPLHSNFRTLLLGQTKKQ